MSERLSIVISSELNKEIEELQKITKMDKSSLIRQLLNSSLKDVRIRRAIEEYKAQKVSFGKASEIAGVSLWEFIDVCHQYQVEMIYDSSDAEIGISGVKTLNLEEYKKKVRGKK